MKKRDLKNREDIYALVSAFYSKVGANAILGPFFNDTIKDWDAHFELLTIFWESSLFLKTRYTGDPLKAHIEVDKAFNHSISELHFGIWLNLWFETVNELFEGDYAENAKRRARKMATFMQAHSE
ncbi:group III truncated hemoglobin [Jejuia pallidilutea]|uniref:Truncated hemoglobins n=2 Tax=Jejuia pallidilutea TaxID=504487 RepID=A0A098LTE8_9FLAO|nr:group III truncated hemoglobin [Jejuia pallidilutea]GAL89664.1 truncated hemoglobins [Jejuia pallidilutea]